MGIVVSIWAREIGKRIDFQLDRISKNKTGGKRIFSPQYTNRKEEIAEIKLFLMDGNLSNVLDYGCGEAPYRYLAPDKWIGIDIDKEKGDYVIEEHELPNEEIKYSHFLCTSVMEHMNDINKFLLNFEKKVPDGTICLFTIPFLVHEHGAPNDFWRFTYNGVEKLFEKYEIINIKKLYGVGFCVSHLINVSIDSLFRSNILGNIFRILFFPFFASIYSVNNLAGFLIDLLLGTSKTKFLYNSVLIRFKKSHKTS